MNVLILGTRGVPARHGGFETFAEHLATYLIARGHSVVVYCQSDTTRLPVRDTWQGIERLQFYGGPGPLGTIAFDYKCVRDALRRPGVILTLGYNTAIFSLLYKVAGRESVMNMDGIEWKRDKWSPLQRLWLRLNEVAGARLSTFLIADHPEIAKHLERLVPAEKMAVIPYGAEPLGVLDAEATTAQLDMLVFPAQSYALIVARSEPENSLLEMVRAFSIRPRGFKLVVVGKYQPEENLYHRQVMECASGEVVFIGAVYDKARMAALRKNARIYLHGHRVGGTNPSLIEALAAHNAVIAHDNPFTRWVAGPGALYFRDVTNLNAMFDAILDDDRKLQQMREASRVRHEEAFLGEPVLRSYELVLQRFDAHPKTESAGVVEDAVAFKKDAWLTMWSGGQSIEPRSELGIFNAPYRELSVEQILRGRAGYPTLHTPRPPAQVVNDKEQQQRD